MWEHRSPRDVALRMLRGLFGDGDAGGPSPPRAFPLAAHQEEGVRRLRAVLDARGGALLADAVGLGKTYMALALIEERLAAGHDVVVVVPAALRGLWRSPLRRLCRARYRAGNARPTCRLVSHAQLSRGVSIAPVRGPRLVVVDEAHRFRNPAALRYGALARLVRGGPDGPSAELLLVTATPVNNRVRDLYHLVRLFLADDDLRDAGVPSLRAVFQWEPMVNAATDLQAYDPVGVEAVIRELVVRRTRRAVEERFGAASPPGAGVRFPRRVAPAVVRYADPGLEDRVRRIADLELRPYDDGAAALVRLGLLKRVDSSVSAFESSVRRLLAGLDAFADAAEAGRLLRPGGGRVSGDDDPLQLLLLGVVAEDPPPDLDLSALAASARQDIRRLDRLRRAPHAGDGKARALVALLEGLGGEKVAVFTEYRDTAEHLWRYLGRRFRMGRVDGSGAWLGRQPAGRRVVVERFAPASNGCPAPRGRERVDVLIATDVLAEGLNLQDARHVVSYDLPWNPVRLMQRIGRVDRLGSPHDEVVPHLFVPAHGLDAVLGLTRRLRSKLDGIAATVGAEEADELLDSLVAGGPAVVARALHRCEHREPDDPWETLRTAWLREARDTAADRGASTAEASGPSRDRGDSKAPWVAELPGAAGPAAAIQAAVLAAVGRSARLLEVTADGRVRRGGAGATALVMAGLENRGAHPRQGRAIEQTERRTRRLVRATLEYLQAEAAAARAPTPLQRNGTGARLARRVRTALAHAGSGLDPATVTRAERVLRALEIPLRPDLQSAAAELLEWAAATAPAPHRLVERAAELLGGPGGPGGPFEGGTQALDPAPRIEAVLLVRHDP